MHKFMERPPRRPRLKKRHLKKWVRRGRSWSLSVREQQRYVRRWNPWQSWAWDLQPGDKYLACDGKVYVLVRKEWDTFEWELISHLDDGGERHCHTYSCADPLLPEHLNHPVGTRLPDRELDKYWGPE